MKPVSIVGMGVSPADVTPRHRKIIEGADLLVGGKRLLDRFGDSPAEKKTITRDLDGVIRLVRERMETDAVVVLASGDPLFFGIGGRLVEALGPENVSVFPNVSSVAAAFARIGEPWQDAAVISLHGRPGESALLAALDRGSTVAVLTDPRQSPAWIARRLIHHRRRDYRLCVLEQLGTEDERVGWYGLAAAADREFASLNLVILKPVDAGDGIAVRTPYLGMPESAFARQGGLITKAEVRAVAISKLRLSPGQTLWDLGAGCGSVGIEASLFLGTGRVVAVEKRADRVVQIEENRRRFGVETLAVVQADLPAGIETLPAPDRVFIGGGGNRLEAILTAVAKRLEPGGIVVVNTVLISSVETVSRILNQLDCITEMIQIQVNRGQAMPWGERLQAQNPVWIISGEKR
jgi:precorrin-6B C5,15-methyltransferase / cobalt-precorrin-6B C5,C15-methyltransferase